MNFWVNSVVNKNKLSKNVKKSSKITGQQQHSLALLCEFRAAGKAWVVLS